MRCSVVVPCCNEEPTLRELHRRLSTVLPTVADDYEIILVDDGSTDGTLVLMRDLAETDPNVRYLSLSRNFGQQIASTAGLDRADGDCVILMDADLQDPPECIPDLVAKWRDGFEVVAGRRRRRHGVTLWYRVLCWVFYRLVKWLSDVDMPLDVGDFRLMDRRVVQDLRRCREGHRFIRGLTNWIGYRHGAIEFDRPPRSAGTTKYRFRHLIDLATDAIAGFSIAPLRFASRLGLCVTIASVVVALVVLIRSLTLGRPVPGFALTAAGLFFLGGVQMMLLGLLGEYVGRSYREVQRRPLYLVREDSAGSTQPGDRGSAPAAPLSRAQD